MDTMTVSELKAHFSDVLKKVQAGKEIGISYGKKKEIVARLVPPESKKGKKRKIGLLDGKASVKFIKTPEKIFSLDESRTHSKKLIRK